MAMLTSPSLESAALADECASPGAPLPGCEYAIRKSQYRIAWQLHAHELFCNIAVLL